MGDDIRANRELLNQIVFGMENQDHVFYLDLEDGNIIQENPGLTDSDEERYVPLPPWKSVDGYNLMGKFVQTLRNPIYRERLRAILASGRGVFRQFKDAVGERDDIQRLWLSFKQREMRSMVGEWLNDVRELRGLSRLELSEDEETYPLIASDFVFRYDDGSKAHLIAELDRTGFAENHDGIPPSRVELLYKYRESGRPQPHDGESRSIHAESPAGEVVGFLWAVALRHDNDAISVVRQIYVVPDFRGLGLAAALLREHLLRCRAEQIHDVQIELSGSASDYEDSLVELGFVRRSVTMGVSTDVWFRDNE